MCATKKSSYVNCGCGCKAQSAERKAITTMRLPAEALAKEGHAPSAMLSVSTENETIKDTKETAQKYTNDEIPAHNKLFMATIALVAFMLFTGKSE